MNHAQETLTQTLCKKIEQLNFDCSTVEPDKPKILRGEIQRTILKELRVTNHRLTPELADEALRFMVAVFEKAGKKVSNSPGLIKLRDNRTISYLEREKICEDMNVGRQLLLALQDIARGKKLQPAQAPANATRPENKPVPGPAVPSASQPIPNKAGAPATRESSNCNIDYYIVMQKNMHEQLKLIKKPTIGLIHKYLTEFYTLYAQCLDKDLPQSHEAREILDNPKGFYSLDKKGRNDLYEKLGVIEELKNAFERMITKVELNDQRRSVSCQKGNLRDYLTDDVLREAGIDWIAPSMPRFHESDRAIRRLQESLWGMSEYGTLVGGTEPIARDIVEEIRKLLDAAKRVEPTTAEPKIGGVGGPDSHYGLARRKIDTGPSVKTR